MRARMLVARHPSGLLALDVASAGEPQVLNNWDQTANIAASRSADVVATWRWKDFGVPQVGVFGPGGVPRLHLVGFDRIGGWP